jgi:DNA-binding MarR family transcriptional regulator
MLTETASRLRLAITRTARRLRQEAGGDLSPSATAALATIDRHGPLTPSELAELERVKRPTATRILRSLEDERLIARTPDPEDGRSALVAVTSSGAGRLRRLRGRKNAYLARRMRGLGPGELETLERAAGIIERLLEEEGGRK